MRLSEWLVDKGYDKEFITLALTHCGLSQPQLAGHLTNYTRDAFGIERILGAYCSPVMQNAAIEWRKHLRVAEVITVSTHVGWTEEQLDLLQTREVIENWALDEGVME